MAATDYALIDQSLAGYGRTAELEAERSPDVAAKQRWQQRAAHARKGSFLLGEPEYSSASFMRQYAGLHRQAQAAGRVVTDGG